ncbi:MAG: YIP1 family protein [bacterium]
MKCPKCGYENKSSIGACLMCYAMLKTSGEEASKPSPPPKPKAEKPKPPPPEPEPEVIELEPIPEPPVAPVEEIKLEPTPPPPEPKKEALVPPPPPLKPSLEDKAKHEAKPLSKDKKHGLLGRWWTTLWAVLKSPKSFFDSMPRGEGLAKPFVFILINMIIAGIGFFLLFMLGSKMQPNMHIPALSGIFMLLGLVVFVIIFGILSVTFFIQAAVINICAKLLMGTGNFEDTFDVVAYSSAVNVFNWIPFVNILMGLYGAYILIVGLKKVHNFSTGKVTLALLMPLLLGVALAIIFVILGSFLGSC